MKRLVSILCATCVAVAGGAVTASPASAAAADAWAYSGTYYSGTLQALPYTRTGHILVTPFPVRSLINHTGEDLIGSRADDSASYFFWHSTNGGWATIGDPFAASGPHGLWSFKVVNGGD